MTFPDIRMAMKAIAGATAAAFSATSTAAVIVPASVEMPWWGYILVALVNAGIAAAAIYYAPANKALTSAE